MNDKMSGFFSKAKAETEVFGIEAKRKSAVNQQISQIRSAEQTLRYIYEEIGRKVFLSKADLEAAPIAEDMAEAEKLCEKIKQFNEQIEQINKEFDLQVGAIRSQACPPSEQMGRLCGKCGLMNQEQATFCAGCGNPLASGKADVLKEAKGKICPNCNAENAAEDNFCLSCGAALKKD